MLGIESLTYLQLRLNWVGPSPRKHNRAEPDYEFQNVGIFLSNLRLAEFARNIAIALPNLRIIGLTTSIYEVDPDFGEHRANRGLWTIHREDNGHISLQMIPTRLYPEVFRREKMLDLKTFALGHADYGTPPSVNPPCKAANSCIWSFALRQADLTISIVASSSFVLVKPLSSTPLLAKVMKWLRSESLVCA